MYRSKVFGISILFNICTAYWLSDPLANSKHLGDDQLQNDYLISQPVDHFNPQDNRTWPMKIQIENLQSKTNGPIYLVISPGFHIPRVIYKLALKTHGIVVMPTTQRYQHHMPLDATTPDYLKYLTSKQILADLVNVIKFVKSKLIKFKESKVVAEGNGFGATLAVWLRQIYPEHCDIVLADGASVLAKFEFPEYLEKTSETYKTFLKPDCIRNISNYFVKMDNWFNSPDGIKEFKKEFNVCENVDMTDRLNQHYYAYIKTNKVMETNGYPDICHYQEENTQSLDNKPCHNDTFEELVTNAYNDTLLWVRYYMQCNELGWFMTSSPNQIFSKRLVKDYYVKWCERLYGFTEKEMLEKMENTNRVYGGLRPNVTQVFLLYGGFDPYISLGITKDLSPDALAVVIPEYYSGLFFYVNRGSEEFQKAIQNVNKMVIKWLGL